MAFLLVAHSVVAQRSYNAAYSSWMSETARRESAGTLYHAIAPRSGDGMMRARPNMTELEAHILLIWNSHTDLDIHVTQPDGEELYYGNPMGRRCFLLLDENAAPPFKEKPVEDFYIMKGAPAGEYVLKVHSYAIRAEPLTPLALHITKHTEVHDSHGQLLGSYDTDPDGDGDGGLRNREWITLATITKTVDDKTGAVDIRVAMHPAEKNKKVASHKATSLGALWSRTPHPPPPPPPPPQETVQTIQAPPWAALVAALATGILFASAVALACMRRRPGQLPEKLVQARVQADPVAIGLVVGGRLSDDVVLVEAARAAGEDDKLCK